MQESSADCCYLCIGLLQAFWHTMHVQRLRQLSNIDPAVTIDIKLLKQFRQSILFITGQFIGVMWWWQDLTGWWQW